MKRENGSRSGQRREAINNLVYVMIDVSKSYVKGQSRAITKSSLYNKIFI